MLLPLERKREKEEGRRKTRERVKTPTPETIPNDQSWVKMFQ
jgi:hypothetical protein